MVSLGFVIPSMSYFLRYFCNKLFNLELVLKTTIPQLGTMDVDWLDRVGFF